MSIKLLNRVVGALAAALIASPCLAADEATDEDKPYIEEIIVTAERREENILDVPMSMTAFDGRLIDELGMTNKDDLEQLVPGLQFGDDGRKVGQGTTMRGVSSRSHGETHGDIAVATYVDGVYTADPYGIAPNLFDLERVEVARGPQGTLHGRNAIAGAISYYSKKPTDTWEVDTRVEFTDQFTQRYNVAFGGPIVPGLMFRITGGYYEGDGGQENLGSGDGYDPGDYNRPDQRYIAPQLRFKTDRLDANLRYSRTDDRGAARTQVMLQAYPDWAPYHGYPHAAGPALDKCAPDQMPNRCDKLQNKVRLNRPGIQNGLRESVVLNVDFDMTDALTLRYVFGDNETDSAANWDNDNYDRFGGWEGNPLLSADAGGPFQDSRLNFPFQNEESSHEILVLSNFDGPFNFIAGYYYYENESFFNTTNDLFATPFRFLNADEAARAQGAASCQDFIDNVVRFNTVPGAGFYGNWYTCPTGSDHTTRFNNTTAARSETNAVFASFDYQINDQWRLAAGLRYTEDKKTLFRNGLWSIGNVAGVPLTNNYHVPWNLADVLAPRSWSAPVWDVTAEYRPVGHTMVYGRISQGYRSGSFNAFGHWLSDKPYVDKEILLNYEVGLKLLSQDQRLQITASAFYNDFDGFQISYFQDYPEGVPVPTFVRSPLVKWTANIDGTSIWGGEVEFIYLVTERLRLSGYYAYLDSEIGPQQSVIPGDPNPQFGFHPHQDVELGFGRLEDDFWVCSPEWLAANPDAPSWLCQYQLPTDNTGNQLAQQPNHKFALTAAYKMPLSERGTLQFLTTYSYTDSRHPDVGNFDVNKIRAYDRWDIRINWLSDSGKWSAGMYVQNVLDEIGLVEYIPVLDGGALRMGTLTESRSVGFTVGRKW